MKSLRTSLAAVLIGAVALASSIGAAARTNAQPLLLGAAMLGAYSLGLVSPETASLGFAFAGVTGLAPFPVQEHLTAIATMYRNRSLIADNVLPRVTVGKQAFKYFAHTLADGFTIPDTKVARASAPNRVEFTATETTSATVDYALDDAIPMEDIENASPGMDPQAKAVEYITNLIGLDREVRTSGLVFNASNYAAANKATLSGTSQWSDFANSDPISAILTALDSMVMRGNIAVMGQAVWTKLSTHPKLVKAFYGTSADTGIVTRDFVAQLFELEAIYVGQAWLNTAKKGQTASLSRAWGKHFALLYRDSLATADRGTTYGFTAQFGGRIAGSFEDKDVGMRGGVRVRAGESVKEVLTATDLGYLFTNAVA